MNEKAIRKLETLSWQMERYMKLMDEVAAENQFDRSERVQGMGVGLIQAKDNYFATIKNEVDRSIAELKADADTYLIDDLTYEGGDEVESA